MGFYINPPSGQINWLKSVNPIIIPRYEMFTSYDDLIAEKRVPLCLIDNGVFNALAILYADHELSAFADIDDLRPKVFMTISREALALPSSGFDPKIAQRLGFGFEQEPH